MVTLKNEKKHIEPWMVRYVNSLKRSLHLSDWTIIMSEEPCSPDCLAETDVVSGQHLARMFLNKSYTKDTPQNIRGTIIHELLHCHLSPISELSAEILKPLSDDLGGSRVIKSAINGIEYETERSIDAISEAIAIYFPLPNMPKPKKKRVYKKKTVQVSKRRSNVKTR
mgnify:CR=1 FL=1